MRIIKNIQNFLYDQEYFISLFQDCLHVYDYQELVVLSDTFIELKLKEFHLKIEGNDLMVSAMDKQEILIKGSITNMRLER